MFLEENTKIFIRYYNKKQKVGHDFRITTYTPDGKLQKYLEAKECRWQEDTGKWRLKNYSTRSFNGMKETFTNQDKRETIDTLLNLMPADFVRFLNQKEMLDSPQLLSFIKAEKDRGLSNTKLFEVEFYRRTSEPVTIFIVTLIGVAIAARKVRGGIGIHLAIGIGLGAIFIFLSKFSVTFATNSNFPPLLGVWIPNIIFGLLGFLLASRAQK
jgi:lipopolysaccharide export system permease protein